ncbi:O-antigen ligase family protein [Peribacillus simplex]|uniref:O-antigen ligase family protein n=1 Tax=Peribacillus simplex TaxID=1478 RepID=UPI0011DCC989|nr:O-antigen ligase family protein [Peribacillus simplex]
MKLVLAYFVFFGFISAFALNKWASIPLMLAFLIFINISLLSLKNNLVLINNKLILICVYCFFITTIISFLIQVNIYGFEVKGVTHTLSYFLIIILYYLSIETSLRAYNIPIEKVFKSISLGVIIVSIFTIIEFISKNFLMLDFDKFVLRPQVEQFNAIYNTGNRTFFRSRGTVEESGVLAMYLLMFLPFVIYYHRFIKFNKQKLILSVLIIVFAVLTTFSAAGFIEYLVAFSIVLFLALIRKIINGFTKIQILMNYFFVFILTLIGLYLLYTRVNFNFLQGILNKVTFSNESSSAGSRLERWNYAFSLIQSSPIFGHGPGIAALQNGTGSTSFYLEVLIETGIIGFTLILGIFLITLRYIFKIRGNVKYVYLFSFIIMSIHSVVISQYLFPWIWTLFAIISYHHNLSTKKKENFTSLGGRNGGYSI